MTVNVLTHGRSQKAVDNFNVNPFSMSITVAAGSNRMLLVGYVIDTGIDPYWVDPIKYGGVNLVAVTGGEVNQTTARHVKWLYLPEASLTTGAANLTVNEGWNQNIGAYFWAVVENAAQTMPSAATNTDWANAALSATVSTPTDGISFGILNTQSGAGSVIGGTTAYDLDFSDGSATGLVDWGWTTGSSIGFTTAVNQDKVIAALVISPSGGGGGAAEGAAATYYSNLLRA